MDESVKSPGAELNLEETKVARLVTQTEQEAQKTGPISRCHNSRLKFGKIWAERWVEGEKLEKRNGTGQLQGNF